MSANTETRPLIRTRLANGIDEFVFLEASLQTVDSWIEQSEIIIKTEPSDGLIRHLYDLTQTNLPPLTYALRRVRELHRQHPNRARSRVAFILTSAFLISLVETFVVMVHSQRDQVRFFRPDQREAAEAWLLG